MTNDDNPSYKCKKTTMHLNHVLEYSQNVRCGIHHSLSLQQERVQIYHNIAPTPLFPLPSKGLVI